MVLQNRVPRVQVLLPLPKQKRMPKGIRFVLQRNKYKPRHAERVVGCGSPVETSAEGRSTDRADRRDQVLLPLPCKMPESLDYQGFQAFSFLFGKINLIHYVPVFVSNTCVRRLFVSDFCVKIHYKINPRQPIKLSLRGFLCDNLFLLAYIILLNVKISIFPS